MPRLAPMVIGVKASGLLRMSAPTSSRGSKAPAILRGVYPEPVEGLRVKEGEDLRMTGSEGLRMTEGKGPRNGRQGILPLTMNHHEKVILSSELWGIPFPPHYQSLPQDILRQL